MHINVILESSQVVVPLCIREAAPMRVLNRQHRERQKEVQRQTDPGMVLAWKTLRQALLPSTSLMTGRWMVADACSHKLLLWSMRHVALLGKAADNICKGIEHSCGRLTRTHFKSQGSMTDQRQRP